MAEISFTLFDTQGKALEVSQLLSYTLTRSVSAPCDALRLRFTAAQPLPEIDRVEAYRGEELLFRGYADTQREAYGAAGVRVFLYARSSACLLVDNEAQPQSWRSPTAQAMAWVYAIPLGFTAALPDCCVEGDYTVMKGTSCYGAINDIVRAATGKNLAVTPDRVLTVLEGGEWVLPADRVLSEEKRINRGGVLSRLDFKQSDGRGYACHAESRKMKAAGICRSRKYNLSAYAPTQRKALLQRTLENAAEDYETLRITVSGAPVGGLYDRVTYHSPRFGSVKGYYIAAISTTLDRGGERTAYELKKPQDLEVITYVD